MGTQAPSLLLCLLSQVLPPEGPRWLTITWPESAPSQRQKGGGGHPLPLGFGLAVAHITSAINPGPGLRHLARV